MLLTVASPATQKNLVTLARVKLELNITVSTSDELLEEQIAEATDAIVADCKLAQDQLGRRGFAAEEMVVTVDQEDLPPGHQEPLVLPWRIPVTEIAIEEDGVTLDAADIECDPMEALVWRKRSGRRCSWSCSDLVVTMTAGWDLASADVPKSLSRACLILVKSAWFGKRRDPLVKAEDIPGVLSTQWWVGSTSSTPGQLPDEVRELLKPYRQK